MKRSVIFLACCLVAASVSATEQKKRVTDRNTLCSLEFGRHKNELYIGSTPMEDACRRDHYESRKTICESNYDRPEIINACILTYDAVSELIRSAQEENKNRGK